MIIEDQAFFHGLIKRLDETIRQLLIEERELIRQMGDERMDKLQEFWKKDLSEEDEAAFKMAMDYWDKTVIRIWARLKRARHTRTEVSQTLINLRDSSPAFKAVDNKLNL